jgi:putative transposase
LLGAPLIAVFDEWEAFSSGAMPQDLIRIYGYHNFHYITCSCYPRHQLLARAAARDVFVEVLNQVPARYRFDVMGYVVMPEHCQFMISERKRGDPSVVMKVLKQRRVGQPG